MTTLAELELLWQDDHFVAVDKPPGWLVHRSEDPRSRNCPVTLERLGDRLNRRLYPVHRLDQATSGVLLFAFNAGAAAALRRCFDERLVDKRYLAVVRGWTEEAGCVDSPIEPVGGRSYQAETHYRRLATAELEVPVGPFPTARYSLLDVRPVTGRPHQIRRHLVALHHPVVGDKAHGDRHHNHMFRDRLGLDRLLLVARRLTFPHPFLGRDVCVRVEVPPELRRVFGVLGWGDVAVPD